MLNLCVKIAMIEAGLLQPIVKTGNLRILLDLADVRDAFAHKLVTATYPGTCNIGAQRTVAEMLDFLISISTQHISFETIQQE